MVKKTEISVFRNWHNLGHPPFTVLTKITDKFQKKIILYESLIVLQVNTRKLENSYPDDFLKSK